MSGDEPLLEVRDLHVEFPTDRGVVNAVDGMSYEIARGETYGVVGESGAGKSVTALSVIDLVENPGRITSGEIRYKGVDLLELPAEELRRYRGNEISMIFQDPMTALNPVYTIGTQITDTITQHRDLSGSDARKRTIELLDDVGIPDAGERVDDYPHQFSGGMRQRALIAMALSCDPDLVIADEPTTALDVTIQAQILELLNDLQDAYDLSIQLITHDMGVIAEMCDRVAVMYAGEKVEEGPVDRLFHRSRHPYTVGLLKAIPRLDDPRERLSTIPGSMPDLVTTPSGCSFRDRCPHATEECAEAEPPLADVGPADVDHRSACFRIDDIDFEAELELEPETGRRDERDIGEPLLEASHIQKYFDPESQSWWEKYVGERKYVHAVEDVSMSIHEGETLGLVGESGCGKTTLGRTLTQLYEPDAGTVLFAGADLTQMGRSELKQVRSDLQVIFQDPFSSLNPRRTVKDIIGRPLDIHDRVDSGEEKRERVAQLLDDVGLDRSHMNRYPHEFSGGQKQRIGIARALAVEPDFIVADEPVSALDVSVQAKILNLLMELQEEYGLTYLFIAHDLNVVQHISDRIGVMYLGEIVELGTVDQVFSPPYHPYTEVLLSSIPQPDPNSATDRVVPEGEPPSPIDPPSGCRFHPRCPYAMSACESHVPRTLEQEPGHEVSCHLFDEDRVDTDTDVESIVADQQALIEERTGRQTAPTDSDD
jgi:peptide/nickel transport system ATP-binding protein